MWANDNSIQTPHPFFPSRQKQPSPLRQHLKLARSKSVSCFSLLTALHPHLSFQPTPLKFKQHLATRNHSFLIKPQHQARFFLRLCLFYTIALQHFRYFSVSGTDHQALSPSYSSKISLLSLLSRPQPTFPLGFFRTNIKTAAR